MQFHFVQQKRCLGMHYAYVDCEHKVIENLAYQDVAASTRFFTF